MFRNWKSWKSYYYTPAHPSGKGESLLQGKDRVCSLRSLTPLAHDTRWCRGDLSNTKSTECDLKRHKVSLRSASGMKPALCGFILERVFIVIMDGGDKMQAVGVEVLVVTMVTGVTIVEQLNLMENFGTMHLKNHTWPSPITSRADLCSLVPRPCHYPGHHCTLSSPVSLKVASALIPSLILTHGHIISVLARFFNPPVASQRHWHVIPGLDLLVLASCCSPWPDVDFMSLRSPRHHLVSCASGVKDFEELQ